MEFHYYQNICPEGAPISPNDDFRCTLGKQLGLFDMESCPELTQLLKVACQVLDVSVASIAMFYNGQCWNMNAVGFPTGPMPWGTAMCPWHILRKQAQTIMCNELLDDARGLELVKNGYRSYFSAPLLTANKHCIGSLCIVNQVPRSFDAGACRVLNNFGELAVRILERYLDLAHRLRESQQNVPVVLEQFEKQVPVEKLLSNLYSRCFRNVHDTKESCCIIVDTGSHHWPILYADNTWKLWTGFARSYTIGHNLLDMLVPYNDDSAPIDFESWQRKADEQKRFIKYGLRFAKPYSQENLLFVSAISDDEDEQKDGSELLRLSDHETLIDKVNIEKFDKRNLFLTFRPLALDLLDEQTPIVGVSPTANMEVPDSLLRLYVVSLHHGNKNQESCNTEDVQTFKTEMSEQIAELLPGVVMGDIIGRGGYGTAFIGQWYGVRVVIKTQDQLIDSLPTSDIKNEVNMGQTLRHPNIVSTLAHVCTKVKTSKGMVVRNFMVLEYCERGTLQDAAVRGWFRKRDSHGDVTRDGPLNLPLILIVANDIVNGCEYLHSKHIVHADLSGGNVLLCKPVISTNKHSHKSFSLEKKDTVYTLDAADKGDRFVAKISDFGKAHDLGDRNMIDTKGYGTITHMPPEVLRDNLLSPAADIYSFGVLLWQMMMGTLPYKSHSHVRILCKVITRRPGDPSGLCWDDDILNHPDFTPIESKVARNLAALAEACMHCDASKRPDVKSIQYQLNQMRDHLSV